MKSKVALGIMLTFLLIGASTLAFNIQTVRTESRTITVPDQYQTIQGAINAANPGDTILVSSGTYYEHLTVNESISIVGENKHNTVIDGSHSGTVIYVTAERASISEFTVQNGGNESVDGGIVLSHQTNFQDTSGIVISYNIISNSFCGIQVMDSYGNAFTSNYVINNEIGIRVVSSDDNIFVNNNSTNNGVGFLLDYCNNNTLVGNAMSNNTQNFAVDGGTVSQLTHNIDLSNTANGKPIYYITNASNVTYDAQTNAGTVYLIRSRGITVKDLSLTNNLNGIFLFNTTDSRIENVTVRNNSFGIHLEHSSNIVLLSNNAENNMEGISLYWSDENILVGNRVTNNDLLGIDLGSSSNNILTSNQVSSTRVYGIQVHSGSSKNLLVGNNFSDNGDRGLALISCNGNTVYHNNFDNANQIWDFQSNNTWDNGYPSGGNYWSDYAGEDLHSGPFQNATGSDGIGDAGYVVNAENEDRYPLMKVYMQLPYYELLADYLQLQSEYDNLVARFNSSQAEFNSSEIELNDLQSNLNSLSTELSITRIAMYALLITAIVLIIVTGFLVTRKPKVQPQFDQEEVVRKTIARLYDV